MGYTIRYEGTKAEMMAKGLDDAYDWYGHDRYHRVMATMTNETREKGQRWLARAYPMMLGITGLSGVPARAIALEIVKRLNRQRRTKLRLKAEGLWAE